MNRTVWRRGTRRNGREELVYRELIPTNSLSIEPTSDRRHVIISRSAWLDAEFLKVRLKMDGRVEKVCRGIRGVRVDTYGDLAIIQRGEALYLLDALRGDAIINEDPVLRERPGTQLMDWVCYKNSIIVAETNLGKLQLKIIQFSPARRRWRV